MFGPLSTSIGTSEVMSVRSCVGVPWELLALSIMVSCSLVAKIAVSCGSHVSMVELVSLHLNVSGDISLFWLSIDIFGAFTQ